MKAGSGLAVGCTTSPRKWRLGHGVRVSIWVVGPRKSLAFGAGVSIIAFNQMARQLGLSGRGKWGGWRAGAGRKPGTATRVAHARRPEHKERNPVSLTLRVCKGLPSLRRKDVFRVVRRCIAASSREDFRVLHFSVQGNHVHLIAEASDER